ncbi:MAG: ParB/RepB/Spo0J family partition protein [Oscillospiraceae bacterium]|nr:ParB/RepB/Spo0J family partition protein [Oscillospiraceae bacterium]
MPLQRKRGLYENNRVLFLPIAAIVPNPNQPRVHFDTAGLEELSASIQEYGILQPLSVRKVAGGYELVSGERRLRAAQMASLTEVPCILVNVSAENSSVLALVENLQRMDLDFVEEASALAQLIRTYGLSQEEAARRLGKSQSAIANKLRLLRLPREVLTLLRDNNCTERHARALLRLNTSALQLAVARHIVSEHLTVSKTEDYVDSLLLMDISPDLQPSETHGPAIVHEQKRTSSTPRRPRYLIRDVRFFLNTITRGLTLMKDAGVAADCNQEETSDSILLTIRIPK